MPQRLDIIRVLRCLPEELQSSCPVQTAVQVYAALARSDFVAYLRLTGSASRSANERLLLAHRLGQVFTGFMHCQLYTSLCIIVTSTVNN